MKNKKTANSFFLKLIASFTIFMTAGIFTLVSNLETVSSTNVDSTNVNSTNADSTNINSTDVNSTNIDSTNIDSTNVNSIDVNSIDVYSKSSIVLQQGVVNELKAGDEFSISLPTNLSSTTPIPDFCGWFTSFSKDEVLILQSVSFIDLSYDIEKGPGPNSQLITIKAIGPGSCDLTLNYAPVFGDIDSIRETIVYNIKVLPEEATPTTGVILDSQKINEVNISDVVIVKLSSNPSTGYTWCYGSSDPSALRLISSNYVGPDSSILGAPGTQIFTFRAMHKGSLELTFKYYRPFEGMANDTETVVYDVFIKPTLNRYLRGNP